VRERQLACHAWGMMDAPMHLVCTFTSHTCTTALLPSSHSYHAEFVKYCNRMDEVWVPSDFSRDVLKSSGGWEWVGG
jgi:hypothetical protein